MFLLRHQLLSHYYPAVTYKSQFLARLSSYQTDQENTAILNICKYAILFYIQIYLYIYLFILLFFSYATIIDRLIKVFFNLNLFGY